MARTTRGGWPHRPQLRRGAAATELCREGADVGGHGAHRCWFAPPPRSHKPVASRNVFCGAAQRPMPRHLSLQVYQRLSRPRCEACYRWDGDPVCGMQAEALGRA